MYGDTGKKRWVTSRISSTHPPYKNWYTAKAYGKPPQNSMQNPKGRAPCVCTWVNVKGKDIRSFFNNIYPALGQAKLELLKNHELARRYLFFWIPAFAGKETLVGFTHPTRHPAGGFKTLPYITKDVIEPRGGSSSSSGRIQDVIFSPGFYRWLSLWIPCICCWLEVKMVGYVSNKLDSPTLQDIRREGSKPSPTLQDFIEQQGGSSSFSGRMKKVIFS